MSALRDDLDYSNPEVAIPQAIDRRLLRVHTSVPGIVQTYDPDTRRAKIQIAIKMYDNERNRFISRAPLIDVPVHTPAAGDYLLHTHLKENDTGQILFSERGITIFKKTLIESNSDRMGFHSEKDATYFPGYGPIEDFVPIDDSGISIQHKDGTKYVLLNDNKVESKWNSKRVILNDNISELAFDTDKRVTIDGDKVLVRLDSGKYVEVNMSFNSSCK